MDSFEIKYQNAKHQPISAPEALQLSKYHKLYFDGATCIREEVYRNQEKWEVTAHNWLNSEHAELIAKAQIEGLNHINIVDHQRYIKGYRSEHLFVYGIEGDVKLIGRNRTLYDAQDKLIGHEHIQDEFGGDLVSKWKYYWDLDLNPDQAIFECLFDLGKDELQELYFNQEHIDPLGQESFSLLPEDIEELMEKTDMSRELAEYYCSSEIIPKFEPILSS